ncbi:MAG: carbohydrate ABC transporter permease [Clostridiales bacterium]|nr:carbohydrate ABC transporter permease [Clostridiales bacterium]
MKIKLSLEDRIYNIINIILATLVLCITLYPFLYVIVASLSSPESVNSGSVWLFPIGINLNAYNVVLKDKQIWSGYFNTIWYTLIGTVINLIMTTLAAYPLSRRTFNGRRIIMPIIAFTMFFGGGMIPTYILIKNLGMLDSRWVMVIPGAISTWNLIIMRSFFENIPESLHEAAIIDGANDLYILVRIVVPLSKPVMAVMTLFYAVGHWNSFFDALLYLNSSQLYPLQMILRKVLIQFDNMEQMKAIGTFEDRESIGQTVRYATIIVSTLPILLVYPFLQKYFASGVMIGAIKG